VRVKGQKNFHRWSDWRIRGKAHEFSTEDARSAAFPRLTAAAQELIRALQTTALPDRVTFPKPALR